MNKLVLLVALLFANTLFAADEAIMAKYDKSCIACHASGVANAPKTGDVKQWADRVKKPRQEILDIINNGVNAMPPKGLCFDCTDDEFLALVDYMSAPQ